MRYILGWIAVNGLFLGANIFGAATSWAFGSLLLLFAPDLAEETWAWCVVAALMLGASIAFCFWVVGFAQREHRYVGHR